MRRHKPRVSPFWAGIVGILAIGAVCYAVFGGTLPFASKPFVLKALFTSQTQLHIPSPVRIAGVDVGNVTGVQRASGSSNAGIVTMEINSNGLPIHANATVQIRSRIFLEGNFYVDLHPGTPNAPILSSGATLPAANTAGPVQLDRILAVLTADARGNLQTLLQGFGAALNAPSTPAQDADQDPSVRGLTGAQALNKSLDYSTAAFRASAIVNQALLGTAPGDLTKVVIGNSQVFQGLAGAGNQLADFVSTFNSTLAALASRQQQIEQTLVLLPPTLEQVSSTDSALDASFGPTQKFAAELLPGVEQLGSTISAGLPWLAQLTALVSPSELGGLLKDLAPAVQQTADALTTTKALLTGAGQLARCFTHNLIPTGNAVIADPPIGTGLKVYQELYQSAVGLAGASGNFDGNGRYVRSSAGGGAERVETPSIKPYGPLFGNAILQPLGTRPAFPGKAPPVVTNVPCFTNAPPNLNQVTTGIGP